MNEISSDSALEMFLKFTAEARNIAEGNFEFAQSQVRKRNNLPSEIRSKTYFMYFGSLPCDQGS